MALLFGDKVLFSKSSLIILSKLSSFCSIRTNDALSPLSSYTSTISTPSRTPALRGERSESSCTGLRGDWLHTFNYPKVELLSATFPIWDHMSWLRHAITRSGDGVFSKTAYGRLALRGLDLNWLMQYFMNGPTKKSGFTYNHYVLVATKS